MSTAERLVAEYGLSAVSDRRIGEAAGQGDIGAVSRHFTGRTGLIRAILRRHGEQVDRIRERHVAEAGDSQDIRDWTGALVRPVAEHLASLGTPSWQARFAVQVMTDPLLRAMSIDEALVRESLRRTLDGLGRCLTDVPAPVRAERGAMARHLITHTCAERERALASGAAPPRCWARTADALTDAIVGLLTAPVTPLR
ncbi:TetR family transcriptional regulator [Streptomyces sp. NBC_01498]|nr:TetR family transcriptional regulator [Streptomyces sp. NBC_01498]WTL29022.1 TetR family transcriptional regulator [Streptomyces sp. NBC_01498]